MITHETPAEVLVTMLGMARTIGKIQWGQLGQDAEKAAASWLGSVDRALEAAQAQNIVLAVENMQLASTIEREWPAFNMVAERVIKVLEPLQDAGALADYLKGV